MTICFGRFDSEISDLKKPILLCMVRYTRTMNSSHTQSLSDWVFQARSPNVIEPLFGLPVHACGFRRKTLYHEWAPRWSKYCLLHKARRVRFLRNGALFVGLLLLRLWNKKGCVSTIFCRVELGLAPRRAAQAHHDRMKWNWFHTKGLKKMLIIFLLKIIVQY